MALNMADRHAVRPLLVPRCTVLVMEYALYILGGGTAANPNNENLVGWAREAIRSPGSDGDFASWHAMDKEAFYTDGSGVSDAALQNIVQTAINNYRVTQLEN